MDQKQLVDWQFEGKPLLESPLNAKAFIYKITFMGAYSQWRGHYYIGYKLFNSTRTRKLGKKKIAALTDKRKSKKEKVITESTWKSYTGSCRNPDYKELWEKYPNLFKREILQIVYHGDWSEKYYEKKHMILEDWESPMCFNGNFEGKIFKKV
jgi:hypothetical protein